MSGLLDLLLNEPSAASQVMSVLASAPQGGGRTTPRGMPAGGSSGVPGFDASGDNPWGIDPNGMNLVSRGDITLDDDAMRSLRQARQAGYHPFQYVGGSYRSPAESAALHDARYDASGNLIPGNLPAADAGQSMHNYGLAFDASSTIPGPLAAYLQAHGWYNGASFGDPPHWSYGRQG